MVYRVRNHSNVTRLVGGDSLQAWPIDSIYISFSSANPASKLGGVWTAFGTGRMLIGVDPADTAMDAPGDTDGAKTVVLSSANLPPHLHSINHSHGNGTVAIRYVLNTTTTGSAVRVLDVGGVTGATGGTSTTANITVPSFSGNSGAGPGASSPVSIMPPYIAVYMWRRTG